MIRIDHEFDVACENPKEIPFNSKQHSKHGSDNLSPDSIRNCSPTINDFV